MSKRIAPHCLALAVTFVIVSVTPSAAQSGATAAAPRPRFALGVGVSRSLHQETTLDGSTKFRPVVQFGSWREGWGPAFSFGAFDGGLSDDSAAGSPRLATITKRPLLAGVQYKFRRAPRSRVSTAVSILGGVAINRVTIDDAARREAESRGVPLTVGVANAVVVRPQATVWYDLTRRIDLQLQVAYQVHRPTLTVGRGTTFDRRHLNADALIVTAGLAVGIF